MDYSFLAARLSFTFICTCIFFSWQINSAAAAAAAASLSLGLPGTYRSYAIGRYPDGPSHLGFWTLCPA